MGCGNQLQKWLRLCYLRHAMSFETDKRILPQLIKEFRKRGGGLHALAWLINAGITHAMVTNRQLRQLRASFYRHILVLWLVDLVSVLSIHIFLPNGLPVWAWAINFLVVIAGSVLAYLMLGMVREENGDRGYTKFPLPNTLTILRLFLTPLLGAAIMDPSSESTSAWLVFTLLFVTAISDTLDGNIARIFKLKSDFGRAWDPAVDVVFHSVIAIALFVRSIVPWWFMASVLVRYLLPMMAGPFVYIFHSRFKVKATWPGKVSSFLLSCFMGMFFIGKLLHFDALTRFTLGPFLWFVVAINVFTLFYFVVRGTRVVKAKRENSDW